MRRLYYKLREFDEESEIKLPLTQDDNDERFIFCLFEDYRLSPKCGEEDWQFNKEVFGILDRDLFNWEGNKIEWIEHTTQLIATKLKEDLKALKQSSKKPNQNALNSIDEIFKWLEKKRHKIVEEIADNGQSSIIQPHEKLEWKGSVSQFGYLFNELVEKGFIEKPKSKGRATHAAFARSCLKLFEFRGEDSSLEKELSPQSNSLTYANREEFKIPSNTKPS